MAHTLLLADDSVTIQRVIELTFSGEDINVLAVGDGEQAIARIRLEKPDIVLADIGMPKRSGYDVAAFIKGDPELKHIPVMLLAGAFEPVDEARAAEVGCDGVLVKPFEPQQVIARVRELLDRAKGAPAKPAPFVARPVERPAAAPAIEFPPAPPIAFPRREEPLPPPPVIHRDEIEEFEYRPVVDAVEPPTASLEPALEPPDESLDDYFDRLDAAFATLSGASSVPLESRRDDVVDESLNAPTLDDLLGPDFGEAPPAAIDLPLNAPPVSLNSRPAVAPPAAEPPAVSPTRPAGAASVSRTSPADAPERTIVADAFTALFAVEQGEPGAMPVRLTGVPAEPVITDAFVDEVARRVLERLAPGAARDLIADVVSGVAERLVREEIARIRKVDSKQ